MKYIYEFVFVNGHRTRIFADEKLNVESLLAKDFYGFISDSDNERTIVNMRNVAMIKEMETEIEKIKQQWNTRF